MVWKVGVWTTNRFAARWWDLTPIVAISDRTSVLSRGRPSGVAGPHAPEQAPALAMPAEHSLRPDKEEMASPVPVEAVDEEPDRMAWRSRKAEARPG